MVTMWWYVPLSELANNLVPNSGGVIFRCHIQSVVTLLLMPDTCEILLAIVHLARSLTLISSPALILHRNGSHFQGIVIWLDLTGFQNCYCKSDTFGFTSSSLQVTCLEDQTRGPNSSTSLILIVQPGFDVTWSCHSNMACPEAPSYWWEI